MDTSMFHKLVMMIVFEGSKFDPTGHALDFWADWIDDATGQQRCIGAAWDIEDLDLAQKEIVIGYTGEDAHDGRVCRGIIYADFDGNVKEVIPS